MGAYRRRHFALLEGNLFEDQLSICVYNLAVCEYVACRLKSGPL
jgi:hypothetical protein